MWSVVRKSVEHWLHKRTLLAKRVNRRCNCGQKLYFSIYLTPDDEYELEQTDGLGNPIDPSHCPKCKKRFRATLMFR